MRDSMVLYTSYSDKFKKLSDEQIGKLARLIFAYQLDRDIPEITDPAIEIAFEVIKNDLDMNNKKYDEITEKRREAIRKRYAQNNSIQMNTNDTNEYKSIQENTNEYKSIQMNTSVTVSDSVSDSVSVSDSDFSRLINNNNKPKRSRFVPPTQTELLDFCIENNLDMDEEAFMDYYTSNGWKVGSQPMKDWKAAARNWARREKDYKPKETAKKSGNNIGLFGDYKQTSSDDDWDGLTKLALKEMNGRDKDD